MTPLIIASVCLFIDVADTNPSDSHPNMAYEVKDFQNGFPVKHGKKSCFDLSKQYYMQYFLVERGRETWYGTKCRYEPRPEDEGKTLVYKGYNGEDLCPVVGSKPSVDGAAE